MHMYLFSRIILVYLKICFKKIFFNIFSPKSPSYIFFTLKRCSKTVAFTNFDCYEYGL